MTEKDKQEFESELNELADKTNMDVSRYMGDIIRENRVSKGFSQLRMAEKLNISRYQFMQYELGRKYLPIPLMLKIAKILNVSFFKFFIPSMRKEIEETINAVPAEEKLKLHELINDEFGDAFSEEEKKKSLGLALMFNRIPNERLRNSIIEFMEAYNEACENRYYAKKA